MQQTPAELLQEGAGNKTVDGGRSPLSALASHPFVGRAGMGISGLKFLFVFLVFRSHRTWGGIAISFPLSISTLGGSPQKMLFAKVDPWL